MLRVNTTEKGLGNDDGHVLVLPWTTTPRAKKQRGKFNSLNKLIHVIILPQKSTLPYPLCLFVIVASQFCFLHSDYCSIKFKI